MNIGFITPEYPHPKVSHSAGIGTSICNLAKALTASGHNVYVFVYAQKVDDHFVEDGVDVFLIGSKSYLFGKWYRYRKHIQKHVQKVIDAHQIDIIEVPDWTGISAFMKFSVPLIIRLHGSDGYFCHLDNRKQKRKNLFFEKSALKGADAIVSVSKFTGSLTKEIFGLRQTITTIPNGIDTEDFKPLDIVINQGQLLYFGTFIRKKGVLELAKIFNKVVEKVPDCRLLLLGRDVIDVFEKISTFSLFMDLLTDAAKNRVTYLQEVPYAEIQSYIASAQVVVLPSYAEAFPMTWLETLAMEKALVSSNIGWSDELMVDGITGFMVNPKEHALYAEKIIEFLNDSDKCAKFGKAARKHIIQNFSTEIITKRNISFYKKCIER